MRVIVESGMVGVEHGSFRRMMHPADAAEWFSMLRWRVWNAIEQARATVVLDLAGLPSLHLLRVDALNLARSVTEAVDAILEERLETEAFLECQYEIAEHRGRPPADTIQS